MLHTYKQKNETWIDIDHGTPEEIHSVMDEYNIHPFIAKELTSKTLKPRIEFHEDYIYCILHFPVWKHTHLEDEKNQEVDFIIGKNAIITARYDTIDALHKFSKELEVEEILSKEKAKTKDSHVMFTTLLRALYSSLFDELDNIEDMIEDITRKIFGGKEKEMVGTLSEVTRTLLNFKRVTDLHHEILDSLKTRGREIFGDEFSHDMEMIILDYLKINTTIRSNMEMLRELRDTNNSLLTSKQNETIKQLTGMGFVILPLSLIAVIFAMRTEGMPLINHPLAFWMVMVIMITSALTTLAYAKHKKWM